MASPRVKLAGKILILSAGLYLLTFCIVFFNIPFGDSAVNDDGDRVGPAPNTWICPGEIPEGASSDDVFPRYTGEEWAFKVYWPFVRLHRYWKARQLAGADEAIEKGDKLLQEVNERQRKAQEKYEREHPRNGH